ncbi:hypothetical protein ACFFX0_29060 [Citricoccus parietis]|uniref:Uncharacterized protein n=1 Tax=Citricoccus parietis TaxID=592307 RepID=A0ABV5G7V1_9MICC
MPSRSRDLSAGRSRASGPERDNVRVRNLGFSYFPTQYFASNHFIGERIDWVPQNGKSGTPDERHPFSELDCPKRWNRSHDALLTPLVACCHGGFRPSSPTLFDKSCSPPALAPIGSV